MFAFGLGLDADNGWVLAFNPDVCSCSLQLHCLAICIVQQLVFVFFFHGIADQRLFGDVPEWLLISMFACVHQPLSGRFQVCSCPWSLAFSFQKGLPDPLDLNNAPHLFHRLIFPFSPPSRTGTVRYITGISKRGLPRDRRVSFTVSSDSSSYASEGAVCARREFERRDNSHSHDPAALRSTDLHSGDT